ncbi:MAG: alpha glucosidase [Proteobacteria bacterium]|nr:alpha glucosidase [Pseudomonadota bacterium]
MSGAGERAWWRGAVVYQVYVRSFFDSNGDGQGDLPGVLAKLDYIEALGVDAIWLSPIHPSPNRDWGYDVADFDGVQPDYGTLDDFKALLDGAHARGIRVLLDEVLAHTSDEHPWFLESRKGAGGGKADWYVWADPALDGTAPNNWLSVFGGPAWSYQPDRRQHYHHKFLRQQPKLNWRTPAAREAALKVLETWLGRGADGFRLDVANAYLHDPALTPNPAVPLAERTAWHWGHASNLQEQKYDANLPENITVLDEIRRRVDAFEDRFVFGEFSEEAERAGGFAASDEGLHAGYSFPLLIAEHLSPQFILRHFETLARHPRHWPCVSFSNHDVTRTVSRFGDGGANPALAKLMMALLLSLKGTTLIYQGEELGLPEADLLRHQLRDPVGDLYYPVAKGRDGCRTPMPWRSGARAHGFTSGTPWLPAAPEHASLTVDRQEADPDSALAFARSMIALRKASPALKWGEIVFLDAPAPILAFAREADGERIVAVFNMSGEPATWAGIPGGELKAIAGEVLDGTFQPWSALLIRT